MSTHDMNNDQFLSLIEHGATVVTPNRRLATFFCQMYDDYQQGKGNRVWETPHILPLQTWFLETWETLNDTQPDGTALLLNEYQEYTLWLNIINQSSISEGLLNVPATVKAVQQAFELLTLWQLKVDEHFQQTEDTQAFHEWARQFETRLQQLHAMTRTHLPERVISLIQQGQLTLPKHFIFAGFSDIPPYVTQCIHALEKQVCDVHIYHTDIEPTAIHRLSFLDTEHEIQQMATWAKHCLAQGSQRIGCVIPNLNALRPQLQRLFSSLFSEKDAFNISSGLALSQFPVIHTALQLLALYKQPMELNALSHLLRSPFLGEAECEMLARAKLDASFRQLGDTHIHLDTLAQAASVCPHLHERLNKYASMQSMDHDGKSPSQWAQYFSQQLAELGWPGERALTSEEYQTVQRWQQLLTEFASLDHILDHLTLQQAHYHLRLTCENTLFQAQSAPAPIQILGLLEAAGLAFDDLWIMGLHDEVWPQTANPNPFIPLELQRQHHMPHASSERELAFSQQLTQTFARNAKRIFFSCAEWEEDYELRPSRLIKHFQKMSIDELQLPAYTSPSQRLWATRDVENITDEYGPPVGEEEKIKGGSFIFKEQAACPFRAFAKFRLNACSLDTPYIGLNALDRGLILHRALEFIWKTIKDWETLCHYSQEQLTQCIETNVNRALKPCITQRPHSLHKNFIKLEIQRLSKILNDWLNVEKERPPFKVIAQEKWVENTIAGLSIKMRVDRIDKSLDGQCFIIDYKTGYPSINDWLDERPNEPQLPLYATSDPTIRGIAFAQIRSNRMRFLGISQDFLDIPGIKPLEKFSNEHIELTWTRQLERWKNVLTQLAKDFMGGDARVEPKEEGVTCQKCNLQSLCRVYEAHP